MFGAGASRIAAQKRELKRRQPPEKFFLFNQIVLRVTPLTTLTWGQREAIQMVPMHPVLISPESSISIESSAPTQSRQEPRSILLVASEERPAKGKKDDLVITPEGPRPRNKVHHVRPGQAVRQNDDGTYTIVPTDEPAESSGKKQNN
jgi:hypothetical protein